MNYFKFHHFMQMGICVGLKQTIDPRLRGVDCLSAIGWQIDASHAEQYSIISGRAGLIHRPA